MRSIILYVIALPLLLLACNKQEDVEPVPADQGTEDPGKTPPQDETPPDNAEPEVFGYGTFRQMPYRILPPRNADPETSYPLLVFLHGAGERGIDNEQQLNTGSELFLRDSVRQKYPAFVVYPQCPAGRFWFDNDQVRLVRSLIDTLQKEYNILEDRIMIGGFSMGAYGTFEIVSQYPSLFDAAVAIAGDGDPSKAKIMSRTRWRIFAGDRDEIVASSRTIRMAEALTNAGAIVSLTVYPGADHSTTWLHAFAEPDFLKWLFSPAGHSPVGTPQKSE